MISISALNEKIKTLLKEKEILQEEIRVSRRAGEITAQLVVKQFAKGEDVLLKLERIAKEEKEVRQKLAEQLEQAKSREQELDREKERLKNMQISAINMMEDIAAARKAADAANEAKSNFLANMSHEIRTPMNGILGLLDILLETDLSSTQEKYAESVRISADSLLLLLNDILDYSKIEAGKLDMEEIEFDLRFLLDELNDLMAIKAYEKGVEFSCLIDNKVPCQLNGDPGRVRQILINLSGNAIKFVEQGEIRIRVSVKDESQGEIRLLFEVIDTGIGIPEDRQNLLFKTFSQVDASTTRKHGGTGLGLAISKQLVEMMGGEIGVTSSVGQGAHFWFSIVLNKQTNPAQVDPIPLELQEKRILIVDDNRSCCSVIAEYLKCWGVSYAEAYDETSAITALIESKENNIPFHAAILDHQLEDTGAESLSRRIKADTRIRDTHLILALPIGQQSDAVIANMEDYSAQCAKPVKKRLLFKNLNNLLVKNYKDKVEIQDNLLLKSDLPLGSKSLPKLRILLAEDNKINQLVAVSMLKKMGHSVVVANNGKEAVELFSNSWGLKRNDDLFSNEPFDLILMDGQMPLMSGIEAAKKIRNLEKELKIPHTPISALTANAMKGDREIYINAGMDEYISKPVNKETLKRVIYKLYNQRTEILDLER